MRRDSDEFTYGYALTVHKSQGSQWDDVVLFDESGAFREHRQRWLYTGLTRARTKLTLWAPNTQVLWDACARRVLRSGGLGE